MDTQTIFAYNKHAQNYDDETADFWEKFPKTFFDKFVSISQGKVLDIGSGPGRDGLILQQSGLDVTCVDASKAMVEISSSKGLYSLESDFNNLPFQDNSFDGVWAYTSLLHVPKNEVQKSISEIKRVLKQNGIFGLGLIEGNVEGYKVSAKVTEPRWFSYYTKGEVEELLGKNNFEILYFEQFKPGKRNYLNYIAKSL